MSKRLIMYLVLSMVGFLLENITKRFKIFFLFPVSILVSLHLYTILHKAPFSFYYILEHLSCSFSILSHLNLIFKFFSFLMEIFRFIFSVTGG